MFFCFYIINSSRSLLVISVKPNIGRVEKRYEYKKVYNKTLDEKLNTRQKVQ